MQENELTITDRELIHALQISPRASWKALAEIIGSNPATLARRWARLRGEGIAWMATYPSGRNGGVSVAFLEISCPPSRRAHIVDQLREDPEVLTVHVTTGNRDLFVTLNGETREQLSGYVIDRIGQIDGITTMRTQLAVSSMSDARRWRLSELAPDQIERLEAHAASTAGVQDRVVVRAEDAAAVLAVLREDPRISVTDLAERLGTSRQRAKTLLKSALVSGRVVVRTEVAHPVSGWPVYAWYFLKVEPGIRDLLVKRLGELKETRLVAPVIGTFDIALAVWLRSIDDINRFELYLAQHIPRVDVDCSVVLRTPIHMGFSLDNDGRLRSSLEGS